MVQNVPYRGQGPALTDLSGGEVHVLFATAPGTTDYIKTGKLRALAVTTASRAEVLPDLPTVADFVPGYEASQWYGMAWLRRPARRKRSSKNSTARSMRQSPILP
jgi:tripartite-type tricarboxylate transporter receptor subunit TctC